MYTNRELCLVALSTHGSLRAESGPESYFSLDNRLAAVPARKTPAMWRFRKPGETELCFYHAASFAPT